MKNKYEIVKQTINKNGKLSFNLKINECHIVKLDTKEC